MVGIVGRHVIKIFSEPKWIGIWLLLRQDISWEPYVYIREFHDGQDVEGINNAPFPINAPKVPYHKNRVIHVSPILSLLLTSIVPSSTISDLKGVIGTIYTTNMKLQTQIIKIQVGETKTIL